MRLLASIAICSAIASGTACNFAVKHPSITAGIVVGTIGLATCSLTTSIGEGDTSFTESGRAKCYGVTAIAGVGIGLLTAFAQWIGMEDADPVTPGNGGATNPTDLEPAPVFVPKPIVKPPVEPAPAPTPEPPPVEPAPSVEPVP
jgi:hypothetical protein